MARPRQPDPALLAIAQACVAMAARARRRRGRRMKAFPTLDMLGDRGIPRALHELLTDIGFELQPSMRPYLRVDGAVTLRYVWRRRDASASIVYSHVLPAECFDAEKR